MKKRTVPSIITALIVAVAFVWIPADTTHAAGGTTWKAVKSGTHYYAEFPLNYDTSKELYRKYNGQPIASYENSSSKRVVTTKWSSWIYYSCYVVIPSPEEHWSEHLSQKNYSEYDMYGVYHNGNVFFDENQDGWNRIPLYKQEYTEYKKVAVNGNTNSGKSTAKKQPKVKKPKATSLKKSKPKKKTCVVSWKKVSKNCTGYQVRYCKKSNFKGCKTVTIKGKKKCKVTLRKLSPGTKYYVQVRACVKKNGKTYCSAWSKTKSFVTKKAKKKKAKNSTKNSTSSKDSAITNGTMTTYSVIKSGNTAYCCCSQGGIYKVDLKTGNKRCLVPGNEYTSNSNMTLKGNYLYYIEGGTSPWQFLYRVNINTATTEKLTSDDYPGVTKYMIKNDKIYYTTAKASYYEDYYTYTKMEMNLDGSSKKKTSTEAKWKSVNSNASGYKLIENMDGDYWCSYLEIPGGKRIFIAKQYFI